MYIHQSVCISAQHTFPEAHLDQVVESSGNKLTVIEPKYEDIPLNILRRMGKAVRMGVGAAMPLVKKYPELNGVIIGTANGGMEDCIKFLNQIIQYEEGTLTPTNFVQSTTNAVAAQIGLTAQNQQYNITHVHRGLAFENALIDAWMLLQEHPEQTLLLGGLDEISSYNFNIEYLGDCYKKETVSNLDLFESRSAGSIAGEGVAMFILNNNPEQASARIRAVKTLHTDNVEVVAAQLKHFLQQHLPGETAPGLMLSGENGDIRLAPYYDAAEAAARDCPVARFKHLSGEYPTAGAFALWLAGQIVASQQVPAHLWKKTAPQADRIDSILIYNTYKGQQHSFMLIDWLTG